MSRGWGAQSLLIGVFSLLSLGLVEVGYRVYTSRLLKAEVNASIKPAAAAPSFSFWAYPAPWRFDKDLGFVFNDGPWLSGNIAEGSFRDCGIEGSGNRYGNVYAVRSDYQRAAFRILLLGSSYSLVLN